MRKAIAPILLAVLFTSACLYGADNVAKETQVTPKKIEVDSNYDGKTDRVEIYNSAGQVMRVEIDNNGDGTFDETIIYEGGRPIRREKDTNNDKKPDVWMEY